MANLTSMRRSFSGPTVPDMAKALMYQSISQPLWHRDPPAMLTEAHRRFNANRRRWQEQLPVAPGQPELGSWLRGSEVGGVWGVGCISCRLAGELNAFGLFKVRTASSLDLAKLQRHANSRQHKHGVQRLFGDKKVEFQKSVPSAEDVEQVLRDMRSGKSYSQGVYERKKVEKIGWCLSEAVLDRDRRAMRTAQSIAVHQDVCDPRLVIRFSMCSTDFRVHKGVLGMARDFGTTAAALKNATKDILRTFCTPRAGAPRAPQHRKQVPGESYYYHLMRSFCFG